MNYFLNNFGIPVYFLFTFLVLMSLLFLTIGFTFWLNKRFNLNNKLFNFLTFISVFGSMLITFYMLYNVPDYLNDGEIQYTFIQEKNNEKRLILKFTRIDHPAGISTVYSHRLKSYDIYNGKQIARQNLLRRYFWNDYSIFGPFGNKAWGYSEKSGVQLLDLYQLKILYKNKDILQKNPELGSIIRIYDGSYYPAYDPISYGIYVISDNGRIFRITPDLQAIFAGDIKFDNINYIKKKYPKWLFEEAKVDGNNVKTVHIKGTELSAKSKIFFSPEIVDYWDDDSLKLKKIWIKHLSSNNTNADCMLSYINEYGEELNSINLTKLLKNKNAQPYFALLQNNEIYLYITCSYYTLSALRIDINKGNIIGRINYIK